MFRLDVLSDVNRLADHFGVHEWFDRNRAGRLVAGVQRDTGETAQSEDRGHRGDSGLSVFHFIYLLADLLCQCGISPSKPGPGPGKSSAKPHSQR